MAISSSFRMGRYGPALSEASHLLLYANGARQQGLTPSTADLWNAMQQDPRTCSI